MSQEQQLSKKLEDLLYQSNVNVSSQQDHTAHLDNNRCLAFESINNNTSLVLMPQHSIERGIPLPKNMLSQDIYYREEPLSDNQEDKQKQPKPYQIPPNQKPEEPLVILQDEDEWLVDELSLPLTGRKKKAPENTKNVLRNFGNAQNQYALYNQEAIQLVHHQISYPQKFHHWVRTLKLQNFDQFKAVWGQLTRENQDKQDDKGKQKDLKETKRLRLFKRVYKKICWKFYTEAAIPYVLSSRMRDAKTKLSHLKYVYRFLEGLKKPEDFSYFKKVEK